MIEFFSGVAQAAPALQALLPLFGGFTVVIYLLWRLFWKLDRRSQMELAIKEKKIALLEDEIVDERTKRFAAEEALARSTARQSSLEVQVQELAAQVARLQEDVRRLREGSL